MQPDIGATLEERGNRYGSFTGHSRITQNLKRAMLDSPNWSSLVDDQKEALEMIAHKIGRILNGDPDYHDSWHDIVGYTKLVADRIQEDQNNATSHHNPSGASSTVGAALVCAAKLTNEELQNWMFKEQKR